MSDDTTDLLTLCLMYVELYLALASMVILFVKHEDYRLYPIPLWSNRRYLAVMLLLWPLLVLAVPFLRYKNRHRTKAEVEGELKAIRLADHKAMMKRFGINY